MVSLFQVGRNGAEHDASLLCWPSPLYRNQKSRRRATQLSVSDMYLNHVVRLGAFAWAMWLGSLLPDPCGRRAFCLIHVAWKPFAWFTWLESLLSDPCGLRSLLPDSLGLKAFCLIHAAWEPVAWSTCMGESLPPQGGNPPNESSQIRRILIFNIKINK